MSRPVYRRKPRSHSYGCNCPRCTQVRSRTSADTKAVGWFWGGILLLGVLGAVGSALSKVPGYAWITLFCGLVVLAVLIVGVAKLNKRERDRDRLQRGIAALLRAALVSVGAQQHE